MSGIEIAGLLLGALPILVKGLDAYKESFGRIRSGFRKREMVKKLARALRMHITSLDALMKQILQHSGCAIPSDQRDLYMWMKQQTIKDEVDEFLGAENAQVLVEALEDCLVIIQTTTSKVAALVPSVKDNAEIREVLIANDSTKRGQIDFIARITLISSLNDLERDIKALDQSCNTLDRFANRVVANANVTQSAPSRKALKLAKSLFAIRKHADNLYSAVNNRWSVSCHPKHEAKLFIDDRTGQDNRKLLPGEAKSGFRVVLAGYEHERITVWHDTVVHVVSDEDIPPIVASQTTVRMLIQPNDITAKRHVTVDNLCSMIENAEQCNSRATLHLTHSQNLTATLDRPRPDGMGCKTDTISLQFILQNATNQKRPLPWTTRMVLAVKLASGFLQLIRTPWMQSCWSASKVDFLLHNGRPADLSQPHITVTFVKEVPLSQQRGVQFKDDLINLGILLLEIWYATTIEDRFPDAHLSEAGSSYIRHACALRWLEDFEDPLPPSYDKAVRHCVIGLMVADSVRTRGWDDMELWKAVCENIVEPLSKFSQG